MSDNDNRYPRDGDEQVLLCDLTPKSLRQVHTVLAPICMSSLFRTFKMNILIPELKMSEFYCFNDIVLETKVVFHWNLNSENGSHLISHYG